MSHKIAPFKSQKRECSTRGGTSVPVRTDANLDPASKLTNQVLV